MTHLETLRAVEWSGVEVEDYGLVSGNGGTCPSCEWEKASGHTADCSLAAAIEAAEKLEALAETWDAEDGDHLGFIPDPDYFVGLGRCATELRNIIGLAD